MEKFFFTECAAAYPSRQKQNVVKATHHIVCIVTGPERQGFPINRSRALSAGVDLPTYVWVGPDEDHIQADFEKKFHRLVALDALMGPHEF